MGELYLRGKLIDEWYYDSNGKRKPYGKIKENAARKAEFCKAIKDIRSDEEVIIDQVLFFSSLLLLMSKGVDSQTCCQYRSRRL